MKQFFTRLNPKKWHHVIIAYAVLTGFCNTANAQCYCTNNYYGTYITTVTPTCSANQVSMPSTGYAAIYPTAGVTYNVRLTGCCWGSYAITIYYYSGSAWVAGWCGTGGLTWTPSTANLSHSTEMLIETTNGGGCPGWNTNSATLTYQIAPAYTPSITESVSRVCNGSTVTYTAGGSASGSAGSSTAGAFSQFVYGWNTAGSTALGICNGCTWTSGNPGNSLYVEAQTNNGGCTANSSAVSVYIDYNTVAGTLVQSPTSGSHWCSGSTVGYTLSGYTGTINNWNYDWTTSSTGATQGWNNWSNGGSATQSWSCSINGVYNELQVNVTVQSGVCAALSSNTVNVVVDPTSVGGTITQTPGTGGHQCTGSSVAYTLAGYTGTINNWNYDWTVSSTGATAGWTNWNNAGSTTQNWTSSINGSYNELQVNATVTSGVCPSATSNTVTVVIDPTSNSGSWVTSPLYACYSTGTTYNASGTATSQSITGYTGSITGWGYGSSGTCTSDEATYPNSAGSATSPFPCCFDAPSDATYMMVAVTSGVCPTAYMCMSPTYNTLVNPTSGSVIGSITGNNTGCQSAGNITLSCSGGNSGAMSGGYFQWYSGSCNGTAIGTGTSLTIAAPATTTSYYVSAADKCGYSGTCYGPITYTVTPTASIASVTGTSALCVGASAIYSANTVVLGGGTGAWSSSNTTVATVNSSGLVTALSPGSCNIIYTITGGCNGTPSASQALAVTALPVVSITAPTTFCTNQTTTLNPGSGGTWVSNNTSAATVSGNTITGATAGGNATFTFTSSTAPNCANTTGAVTVTPLPIIYGVTGGGTYCLGSGSVVGLSSSQTGVNYQLYLGSTAVGSPVPGTGGSISFGSQSGVGTYTVKATTVTNSCQQNMSGSATVTELSPNVTNSPGATGVGTGNATFNGTD